MQMKFRLILAEVPNNNVHPKQIVYGHFTESFDRIRLMPPCLNYPSLETPCSSIMTAAPRNARQNDRHCVPRRGPRDDPWHPPRGLRSTQDHSRHRSAYSVGTPLKRSKASTRPPKEKNPETGASVQSRFRATAAIDRFTLWAYHSYDRRWSSSS